MDDGSILSLRDLREDIQRNYEHRLAQAPWKKGDAELVPAAGACSTCPKRTGASPLLFDLGKTPDKTDACLDGDCYRGKEAAWLKRRIDQTLEVHPETKLVEKDIDGKRARLPVGKHTVLNYYQYDQVKSKTPGAVPALVVRGGSLGETIYIKPHKALGESSAAAKPKPPDPALKAKRAYVETVQAHLKDLTNRELLELGQRCQKLTPRLVATFIGWDHSATELTRRWATMEKMPAETANLRIWDYLRDQMVEDLFVSGDYAVPGSLAWAKSLVAGLSLPLPAEPELPAAKPASAKPATKAKRPAAKARAKALGKAGRKTKPKATPRTKLVTIRQAGATTFKRVKAGRRGGKR